MTTTQCSRLRNLRPSEWPGLLTIVLLLPAWTNPAAQDKGGYNPLEVRPEVHVRQHDLTVEDTGRARVIPLKVYLPAGPGRSPVILFSHGLGGTREGNAYLGSHWSARGYVAVFLQHPGSDDGVWKNLPRAERMAALTKAASLENFLLRMRDVPVVLDRLEAWDRDPESPLFHRLDLGRTGMAGHSFGAVTTQAVSGQTFPAGETMFTDRRICAALALSPSSPRRGSIAAAFASVKIPWMLMTGTKDMAVIGDADPTSRRRVFPALPPGDKYELVLHNAEHSAFTDRPLPGDTEVRNPNHHRAILGLSTAFWDAYLHGDTTALIWLQGEGPTTLLEPDDQWQRK